MNESFEPGSKEQESEAVVETIRTEEPLPAAGAKEPDFDTSTERTHEEMTTEEADPGRGGYDGRDPKKEMPAVPTVKETQDDPKPHDAAPSQKKKRPWGNQ